MSITQLRYYNFNQKIRTLPSVSDREFASVTKTAVGTRDSHAAESGATKVKMGATIGAIATGTLVGDYYGNGSFGAYGSVQATDFIACATPFTVLE